MTSDFMSNETIAGYYGFAAGAEFSSVFSMVSLESILFYIVASAIFVVESLFDLLKSDVDTSLAQRLVHNRQWYVNLARAFQFGDGINPDTGNYDETDEAKQVVDYAAVDEIAGQLFLKVATSEGENLAPLDASELTAFTTYINKVKDAGVKITVISDAGDDLRLSVDIMYDPMVLDENGLLLEGGGEPVKDTIMSFIKSLPFNGEFQVVALVDALQETEGVVIPTVLSAESKYAANDWQNIDARVKPNAGYMVIDEANLTINYRPYDVD